MTNKHSWPIFGRDVPDAAWRPAADAATATRLGRFIRAAGEPDLEALQRHAERDPAWFWGAAADDLGLAWQRRPTAMLDLSRGVEWSRWWTRRRVQLRGAPRSIRARRPTRTARRSPGRARTAASGASPTPSSKTEVDRAAAMFAGLGVGRGRPRRHLHAAAARDGHHRPGAWKAEGDLHPDLLRLRGPGGCQQAQRRRCHLACHGRRHAPPRQPGRP